MTMSELGVLDAVALGYLFAVWGLYARYVRQRARAGVRPSLSRSLMRQRRAWISRMLQREMRVADAALLGNQERVVGFVASTTLILLAAVLTALSSSDRVSELASSLPFAMAQSGDTIRIKFFVLALILVYAFFSVTWSLRQYGFAAILLGAAPEADETLEEETRQQYVDNMVTLLDRAGHDNNSALRAYYFCLAMLFWMFNTWVFMLVTSLTVLVLYQRECRSMAVHTIEAAQIGHPGGEV